MVERFRQGQLTEQGLRQALERPAAKRQDLLYLQATSTALTSSLLGMTLVRAGEVVEDRCRARGCGRMPPCWKRSATAGAWSSSPSWR